MGHHPKDTPLNCCSNKDAIRILVDTIIYEPINQKAAANRYDKGGSHSNRHPWQYITGSAPAELHPYLSEFKLASTAIKKKETVNMFECDVPCLSHPGHVVLSACPRLECPSCKRTFCGMCSNVVEYFDDAGNKKKKNYLYSMFIG